MAPDHQGYDQRSTGHKPPLARMDVLAIMDARFEAKGISMVIHATIH
jgi:hypothetical protein